MSVEQGDTPPYCSETSFENYSLAGNLRSFFDQNSSRFIAHETALAIPPYMNTALSYFDLAPITPTTDPSSLNSMMQEIIANMQQLPNREPEPIYIDSSYPAQQSDNVLSFPRFSIRQQLDKEKASKAGYPMHTIPGNTVTQLVTATLYPVKVIPELLQEYAQGTFTLEDEQKNLHLKKIMGQLKQRATEKQLHLLRYTDQVTQQYPENQRRYKEGCIRLLLADHEQQ